jgi:hypothetical protein
VSRLVSSLQAVARYEVERRTYCELAVITSVFDGDDGDDAQTVSIRLRDSGEVITGVPVAVPLTGLAALPRVDDVVVVVFAHGEPSSPIVVGQVYSDARRPPQFTKDEAFLQWPGDADDPDSDAVVVAIKSDGSDREMRIALGGDKDALVRVADGAVELTSGGVELSLSHSSSSDGKATLSAGGTKVELAQDGDVTIMSAKNLTIQATKIELKADVSLKINGQTVEIN